MVHRGQRHFGVGGGLAIGQRGANGDARLAAHRVAGFVGRHGDVQAVRLRADFDFGQANAKRRLAQIDHRCRRDVFLALVPKRCPPLARRFVAPGEQAVPRHLAQAPAQCQHADIDVGPPAFFNLQADSRVFAVQLHHFGVQHAFALHGDQRGGKAKRHPHLELGDVAGLVAFLLGQQVHAVVVLAAKPQFTPARHPDGSGGVKGVAVLVARGGDQFDFAGFVQQRFAQQQAAAVAFAGADGAEVFGLGLAVVAVKTADHALSAGGGAAGNRLHLHRHIGQRFAAGVQRQRLKAHLVAGRNPAVGLDASDHGGRPQRVRAAQGLHFAIGVSVVGLDQQILRGTGTRHVVQQHAASACAVKGQRQFVGNHARIVGGAVFFLALGAGLLAPLRGTKTEVVISAKVQLFFAHQRRDAHRPLRRRPARDIVQLHAGRHRAHVDQRSCIGRGDAPLKHRQAEFFDAELA